MPQVTSRALRQLRRIAWTPAGNSAPRVQRIGKSLHDYAILQQLLTIPPMPEAKEHLRERIGKGTVTVTVPFSVGP